MKKILCVCLGNICRSPVAEEIFRSKLSKYFLVESRGTSSFHEGSSPDARSISICKKYGLDIINQKSSQLKKSDGKDFDYIFVMDEKNLEDSKKIIDSEFYYKIKKISKNDIADPYYNEDYGFEIMFQNLEIAIDKIILEFFKS